LITALGLTVHRSGLGGVWISPAPGRLIATRKHCPTPPVA